MGEATDDALSDKVRARVAHAPSWRLTAGGLDEVVLTAAGLYDGVADLFDRAEQARSAARIGAMGRQSELGCLPVLALVFAACGAGGVFARYGRSNAWTWMVAYCLPVAAGLIVLIGIRSWGRPVNDQRTRTATMTLVIMSAAGALALFLPSIKAWERTSIIASLVVALAVVITIHSIRLVKPDQVREVDLARLQHRRAARQKLAAIQEQLTTELTTRLRERGADHAQLERLWSSAVQAAEKRGITGLERRPGAIGMSRLGSVLDIPHDHQDKTDERLEAKWQAADQRDGREA